MRVDYYPWIKPLLWFNELMYDMHVIAILVNISIFSIKDVFKKIIEISLGFFELCLSTYRAEKSHCLNEARKMLKLSETGISRHFVKHLLCIKCN